MEQPINILEPQKRMPFTLAVAVRLVVLIPLFSMSVFMIVAGYLSIQKGHWFELSSLIAGIFFCVMSCIMLLQIFVFKKRQLAQIQYRFYPDRLVIYNQIKEQPLHELFYREFPAFTFHENLNNFGYIVIGTEEPLVAKSGIFKKRWGVNMADPEIVLENLPEVRNVYLFLKGLVDSAKEIATAR